MYEDYFLRAIELWHQKKHTPSLKKNLREIFNQFYIVKSFEELPIQSIQKIESRLRDIYSEVYG
jgi:hypothetical protein